MTLVALHWAAKTLKLGRFRLAGDFIPKGFRRLAVGKR